VLYGEAETGKRRVSGLEAIGVFADVSIRTLPGDQIVARDIAGSSAGELIRFLDDVIIILEKR
jgi:hypothetical protein